MPTEEGGGGGGGGGAGIELSTITVATEEYICSHDGCVEEWGKSISLFWLLNGGGGGGGGGVTVFDVTMGGGAKDTESGGAENVDPI